MKLSLSYIVVMILLLFHSCAHCKYTTVKCYFQITGIIFTRFIDTWPPYASFLTLEIVERNGQRFVRAIFNDEEKSLLNEAVWIPYENMVNALNYFSISESEYLQDCSAPDTDDMSNISKDDIEEQKREMAKEIEATLGEARKYP